MKWVRQRRRNIVWHSFYVESKKIVIQMTLFAWQEQAWTWRMNLWLPGGVNGGKGWLESLRLVYTHWYFRMNGQQGPTVSHKGLCLKTQGSSLDGRGVWGRMDICICMLIRYTPIGNKKLKIINYTQYKIKPFFFVLFLKHGLSQMHWHSSPSPHFSFACVPAT